MRIFIGGAHNGKRDYVKTMLVNQDVQWFEGTLPDYLSDSHRTIIITGIENWLAKTQLPEVDAIAHVMKAVVGQDVIFILTDIGRGIVPIDSGQRELRDTCGRLYQRLIAEADEVTRIWYGLAQTIKKRGEVL